MSGHQQGSAGSRWLPPEEIEELMPAVSGNDLNGLGETDVRRPVPVMWTQPSEIAHGPVQEYITKQYAEHPVLSTVMRKERGHKPVSVAHDAEAAEPQVWSDRIKRYILDEAVNPVDLVGVAEMEPAWVFEGYDVPERWIVLLGVQMDYNLLSRAPEASAAVSVHEAYNDGTYAARELADWIRQHGHTARGHGGPGMGPVSLAPAAIKAGFGELGKHGSLINRDLGSGFRLSCVLTDLPLVPDQPDVFGADDFCHRCRACTRACPPDAIFEEKQTVRGEQKWYVDFDRCLPYFADTYGCAICISVCPWTKPGVAKRLADKFSEET